MLTGTPVQNALQDQSFLLASVEFEGMGKKVEFPNYCRDSSASHSLLFLFSMTVSGSVTILSSQTPHRTPKTEPPKNPQVSHCGNGFIFSFRRFAFCTLLTSSELNPKPQAPSTLISFCSSLGFAPPPKRPWLDELDVRGYFQRLGFRVEGVGLGLRV